MASDSPHFVTKNKLKIGVHSTSLVSKSQPLATVFNKQFQVTYLAFSCSVLEFYE